MPTCWFCLQRPSVAERYTPLPAPAFPTCWPCWRHILLVPRAVRADLIELALRYRGDRVRGRSIDTGVL